MSKNLELSKTLQRRLYVVEIMYLIKPVVIRSGFSMSMLLFARKRLQLGFQVFFVKAILLTTEKINFAVHRLIKYQALIGFPQLTHSLVTTANHFRIVALVQSFNSSIKSTTLTYHHLKVNKCSTF